MNVWKKQSVCYVKNGKTIHGRGWRMMPDDRAWLYTLAAYAGLRASELASLTRSTFNLSDRTLTVQAAYSKRRRGGPRSDDGPAHGKHKGMDKRGTNTDSGRDRVYARNVG